MTGDLHAFGPIGLAFVAIYLLSLLAIGWLGYRRREAQTMGDFFLGGRSTGFLVLLLTLYATQYSGNTLFLFTGRAFRHGYWWLTSLHFMTAIVVFYLLFAPQLYRLSRGHRFITPGDYLHHRFGSRPMVLVATVLMVVAICNYLIGQMMAMGRALEGLTTLDADTAYICGVVLLTLVILVYESLGGFRAVVWTDAIQGILLLLGFALLLVIVLQRFGTLGEANALLAADPETVSMVRPPGGRRSAEWLSYILIVGIGGALYPQAIQRIYAARSGRVLRRSLGVMVFLPLTTTLVVLAVGIIARAHWGEIGPATFNDNAVLAIVCREIQQGSVLGHALVVVLFAAILAALMSTADSVLLSISSMVTKDLYGRFLCPDADEARLTRTGKWVTAVFLVIAATLAILLRNTDLIKLLDRKFDLLIQMAPAFFLGIHWARLRAGPVFTGMIAGAAVALLLGYCPRIADWLDPDVQGGKPYGLHPGLYGLAINSLIATGGSAWMTGRTAPDSIESRLRSKRSR